MNSARSSMPVDRALATAALIIAGLFSCWLLTIATVDSLAMLAGLFCGVAWVSFPYLILAHASERLSTTWASRMLIGLGIVGCAAYGMWAFGFVDEDAQGGLMVLFAPFYQLVGAGCVYILVIVIEMVKRRLISRVSGP